MQQVRPSIWVLLSKKRGLKQRLQIAWDSVGIGNRGSVGSTEDRTFSGANAYRRVYFLVYFFEPFLFAFYPIGRERGEKIVD